MRAFAQAGALCQRTGSAQAALGLRVRGDEAFFASAFEMRILEHLVPAEMRDFSFLSSISAKMIWLKFSTAPARLR